ncbi:FAD-dependent monooxygenase [Amycolatopsis acidicola]|uniref:Flavin-dependent monooxygenase n=2 Tax=Amycolatopsis acidicola TaxID=2596893 RepID=A0A5N0UML9_9PSEU|nr:FAD-dependent monooxygenase [Amycolatopsis acidicola]
MNHYPIAIVGGGLGGLTLARVLQVNGVEAALFELEPDAEARTQGGMLDIHDDTGQPALRAAGLYDGFRTLVHEGGQAFRLVDSSGVVRFSQEDDGDGGRPEVDRGQLRQLLLDSLAPGTVHWGKKATGVRALGGGEHEVTFADGTVITTGLLIGADGAWSKIRSLVSAAKPSYTGISFVETDLREPDAGYAQAAALIGGGMFMSLGENKGFLAHRETDGSLHVYTAITASEDWLDIIDFTDTATAKKTVLAEFGSWHENLRALVGDAGGEIVPRRIYALPVGHSWARTPGVTLLGDAAHLMSPFAGEGANLAMFDGAELARAIVAHPGDTEAALAAYEAELFPRGENSAAESAANLESMFGDDGLDATLAFFQGH